MGTIAIIPHSLFQRAMFLASYFLSGKKGSAVALFWPIWASYVTIPMWSSSLAGS
jgi:hypothetical protein